MLFPPQHHLRYGKEEYPRCSWAIADKGLFSDETSIIEFFIYAKGNHLKKSKKYIFSLNDRIARIYNIEFLFPLL